MNDEIKQPTINNSNIQTKEHIEHESNLVKHARKELQIAGLFDKNSDYNGEIANAVMELMDVFSRQSHSGNSASIVNMIFHKLADYKTITPLTGKDEEWVEVGENVYQNNRNSAVFKDGKDSKAHYIDAIVWKTQKGQTWSGKTSSGIGSKQYIKSFPFQPITFYIDVTEEEVKKDDWMFHINDKKDLDKVWEVYDVMDDKYGKRKMKPNNNSSLTDRCRYQNNLELRRPSIERIIEWGKECLEHDTSWYEFYDQCKELLNKENKTIKVISNK